MGKVFINYRREDTRKDAEFLHLMLSHELGRNNVLMDVHTISIGTDFEKELRRFVVSCDVLIALIGPSWRSVSDEEGQWRLKDPKDWVRVEIETAMERGIMVIPVLVDGAEMPTASIMPPPVSGKRNFLEAFTRRQPHIWGETNHRADAQRLCAEVVDALRRIKKARTQTFRQRLFYLFRAVLILLTVGLILALAYKAYFEDTFNALSQREAIADWSRAMHLRPNQECDDCPQMIVLRSGEFRHDKEDEPGSGMRFFVDGFAISQTEITFKYWDACVKEGYCREIAETDRGVRVRMPMPGMPRATVPKSSIRWDNFPVVSVSWQDITGEGVPEEGFLAWVNSNVDGNPYRLPSEAEWEYAARAGTITRYWWGDEAPVCQADRFNSANFKGGTECPKEPMPVGSFKANPWRLYDMHGNVREWVQDCWHPTYGIATGVDNEPLSGKARMAEKGGQCDRAVVRGGSWFFGPEAMTSTYRDWADRSERFDDHGFRIARDLADPPLLFWSR